MQACERVLGRTPSLDGIPVAGRTDWRILADIAARVGQTLDARLLDALRGVYIERLREEIQHPGEGVKGAMPGVPALLSALNGRTDAVMGLLTGNFEEGARIKLEYFDLWRYFRCGAYGDDAADRNALVPFAVQRATACTGHAFDPQAVVVIGDTPLDVECARAAGARPIGVATGGFSVEQLRRSGAETVFPDLRDTAAVLRALFSDAPNPES